ncbi:unnamed protein product [Adineta steineri]|uniref:Uncharacterized protein n=1 Tax=Adineta steineri TaxID=433720 RepID=A0A818UUI8_9BILA|nr:unnamed protein product [Adineta steineri]CAF3696852.1 unnamed protein product [Adineta steineri]
MNNGVNMNVFYRDIDSDYVKSSPLHILFFAEFFPSYTCGVTRRLKEIVQRLVRQGHYIYVITGCKDADAWLEDSDLPRDRITFFILASTNFKNKINSALPFLYPHPAIFSAICQFSPDVVHIVDLTPASTLCGTFAKALNKPIIWSLHTNIDAYLSNYIRLFAVKYAQRVYQFIRVRYLHYSTVNLTVSQDFADFITHRGVPQPIVVWKTGVDSTLFHPAKRSRSMRYRMFGTTTNYTEEEMDRITVFVSVGRISPEKNFEFLSLLLERISCQSFLCIIGDGPYRYTLEPYFSSDRVYFFGYLDGEELANAYASADYFIYASVSETFGQVYLEAMASGTPVVAAKGSQLNELFVSGECGYMWEPGNLDSAEQAIGLAMKDRDNLSIKARQQALKYSWDSATDQINNIYRQAIVEHPAVHLDTTLPFSLAFFSRLFYYCISWFFYTLLAILFIAPFVRVSSPMSITNRTNNKTTHNRTET